MKKLVWIGLLVFVVAACDDILEVPDISNQQIQLLAPVNGTVVKDSVVRLNWGAIGDAEGYIIQVARPNFENAAQFVVDTTIVVDSTFVGTRLNRQLLSNDYEWRVKAFNSAFETDFSNSTFTVE